MCSAGSGPRLSGRRSHVPPKNKRGAFVFWRNATSAHRSGDRERHGAQVGRARTPRSAQRTPLAAAATLLRKTRGGLLFFGRNAARAHRLGAQGRLAHRLGAHVRHARYHELRRWPPHPRSDTSAASLAGGGLGRSVSALSAQARMAHRSGARERNMQRSERRNWSQQPRSSTNTRGGFRFSEERSAGTPLGRAKALRRAGLPSRDAT